MSLDFISLDPDLFSLDTVEQLARQYGYWAVFFGILLENVGLPIPGETVTIAGGFLAGNDQLNYWLVLGDAALGAAVGGNIGYWIGRYGGWPLLLGLGRVFRVQEAQLASLRDQFGQNAAKAVFLGRFVALLRMFASPLAGIAQMPYGKFMLVNTAGALAWASVMVTLSYAAGRVVPLEQIAAWVSRFALLTLLIVVAWLVIPLWLESRKAKQELDKETPSEDNAVS